MSIPTIRFEPARFEVGTGKNRPAYRWVDGLYVIANGNKIFPPMRTREAKAYARQLVKAARLATKVYDKPRDQR